MSCGGLCLSVEVYASQLQKDKYEYQGAEKSRKFRKNDGSYGKVTCNGVLGTSVV